MTNKNWEIFYKLQYALIFFAIFFDNYMYIKLSLNAEIQAFH